MFSAADISVVYALEQAQKSAGVVLGDMEETYLGRITKRDAYKRAMEVCVDRKAWFARHTG